MDNEKLLIGGIVVIVAVLAIPFVLPLIQDSSARDAAINQQRLETLNNAVQNYAKINQQYPRSLHDLVPDYLAEVPLTVGRQPYQYNPDTGEVTSPVAPASDEPTRAGRQGGGGGVPPAADAITGLSVSEELNF